MANRSAALDEDVEAPARARDPVGDWERDIRTGETWWSEQMERILGAPHDDGRRGPRDVLEYVHPDDRARVEAILGLLDASPEAFPDDLSAEFRVVRTDGTTRAVRAEARLERDEQDRPARWIGTLEDITDEPPSERELRAHHGVSETLREWQSFDEGVMALLERLGDALGYPMGSAWLWDDERGGLRCRAFWSAHGNDPGLFEYHKRKLTFRPGEGKPGAAWATREPVVTPDTATDPLFEPRQAAMMRGIRSGLAFPAVGPEGPVVVLSFYSFDHRIPSASLVRTLTALGQDLGRFLHRRRAQLQPSPLTPRELQILRLAAEGHSRPEIADRLGISPLTVKTHFENIYEKLGVSDRTAAVAEALRTGLIE